MFIARKHIARRTFLRGAGVTLALPLLESMVPALTPTRLTAAAPVRRFVGIWHPHGASPGYWSPLQEGRDFDFSFITKPLEPFRNRVVLISGLDMPEAMATTDEPGGDHARGAVLLSGARPRRNAVSPSLGVTVDQHIAAKYGQDTILSSLQLGVEDMGNFGNCNWGYSCAYTNSISWSSPTSPLPTQVNPRVVFERLFGDGTSPEERLRDRQRNASILDAVIGQLGAFKNGLGAGDRARVDTYVDHIRELERRIRIAMENSVKEPESDVPFGLPQSKHEHFRLMYDLMALAFEGDITRSITFMLGRDLSGASFPESGFNGGWHGTSHHGDKPENIANYAKVNRYHVQNLAYFCDKLNKVSDGDGTLLDHVLIYKGSNMGNSHRHAHEKVPVVLVGGIDGTFKGNRHLVFPDNTQRTSNMLLSVLHLFGIEMEKIGTSTGRLKPPEMVQQRERGVQRELGAPGVRGVAAAALVAAALSVPVSAQIGGRPTRPQVQPPQGAVRQVIFKNCTSCHGIDDYAFYALDRAGWSKLIDDKHSVQKVTIGDADRNLLLDWLVSKFGPDTKAFPRTYVAQEVTTFFSDSEAEELLGRSCRACHDLERVNTARFSPDRWRVVTVDMRERGAKLTDEELERLVEWLGRVKGTNPNQ